MLARVGEQIAKVDRGRVPGARGRFFAVDDVMLTQEAKFPRPQPLAKIIFGKVEQQVFIQAQVIRQAEQARPRRHIDIAVAVALPAFIPVRGVDGLFQPRQQPADHRVIKQ
jgi:hypothetical protein